MKSCHIVSETTILPIFLEAQKTGIYKEILLNYSIRERSFGVYICAERASFVSLCKSKNLKTKINNRSGHKDIGLACDWLDLKPHQLDSSCSLCEMSLNQLKCQDRQRYTY